MSSDNKTLPRADFQDLNSSFLFALSHGLNIETKLVYSGLSLNWFFENEILEEEKLKLIYS